MLLSNVLFQWRQENTSSLRLILSVGRPMIETFSLRQRLHLLRT